MQAHAGPCVLGWLAVLGDKEILVRASLRPLTQVLALESRGPRELWWNRVVSLGCRPFGGLVGTGSSATQRPEPSWEAGPEASAEKGPAWTYPRPWAEADGAGS